jgi:hypothetical protein
MFAYEDELNRSLVIAAGLYSDWIDSPKGMGVKEMSTYYGKLNYSIRKTDVGYIIELSGDLEVPAGGIRIRNFKGILPQTVMVNGEKNHTFDEQSFLVKSFPAMVESKY